MFLIRYHATLCLVHQARPQLVLMFQLWAISLPRHLRFDEHNLGQSIAKLSSPVPEISTAGFLYAYMHAIAECGMFYLQAAVGASSNPGFAPAQSDVGGLTAQRQSQAVDNIAVVLEALGERGRESCLSEHHLFLLLPYESLYLDAVTASPSLMT